ncbi:MAG TPA: hypothetical protein VFQ43_13765, partial [Nitrososphaera sp.]|nr:hypothetical protein [Nitrososphaera sp.]
LRCFNERTILGNHQRAQSANMAEDLKVPDFDDIPEVQGMPKGCAWGVFDTGGRKDVYGTLNLLTPKVVREAVQEVKEGVSISLKYEVQFHARLGLIDSAVGLWARSRLPNSTGKR